MKIEKVHFSEIKHIIDAAQVIKKKRERAVFFDGKKYYKVWVPNWTQGDILEQALKVGFYHKGNASALESIIYDETGTRGYICKSAEQLAPAGSRSWDKLIQKTSYEYRLRFMLEILEKSLESGGMYVDLVASNMVLVDNNISLIDLDSYNSFSLIFDRKKDFFEEKFDLDAWWKPHETAKRDVDLFYRSYLKKCLDIDFEQTIDNINKVKKLVDILKQRGRQ
jgi:hypothetical protein